MRIVPLTVLAVAAVGLGVTFVRAAPEPADRALTLMSYNLNFANPDPRATLDAIASAAPDVVLLQEVDQAWEDALVARFSRSYPYRRFHLHATRPPGGIAVLSKYPLAVDAMLAPPRGAWFPAERLVVTGPFGEVQVLNVHLRPAHDGTWIHGYLTTPPIRLREVEAYWPKLAPELPTVIAGDFNEEPTGSAVSALGHHGLVRVPTAGPTTWHYEQQLGGKRVSLLSLDIDHVLVDDRLTARDAHVLDAGASDHRPVVVTLAPN